MDEGSEGIASSQNNGLGSSEAHHVSISPQEDCGGAKGEVGEGERAEEEGGLEREGDAVIVEHV